MVSRRSAPPAPPVPVRGRIKLGQFLKLAGLVEDGGQARVAVQCGDVRVMLADGDVVTVDLPIGAAGATVEHVGRD